MFRETVPSSSALEHEEKAKMAALAIKNLNSLKQTGGGKFHLENLQKCFRLNAQAWKDTILINQHFPMF